MTDDNLKVHRTDAFARRLAKECGRVSRELGTCQMCAACIPEEEHAPNCELADYEAALAEETSEQ